MEHSLEVTGRLKWRSAKLLGGRVSVTMVVKRIVSVAVLVVGPVQLDM
jgi:hypothetical protein